MDGVLQQVLTAVGNVGVTFTVAVSRVVNGDSGAARVGIVVWAPRVTHYNCEKWRRN